MWNKSTMLFAKKRNTGNDGLSTDPTGARQGSETTEHSDVDGAHQTIPSIVQFYSESHIDFQNDCTLAIGKATTTATSQFKQQKNKVEQVISIHPYATLTYHSATVATSEMDQMLGIWNIRSSGLSVEDKKVALLKELLSEVLLKSHVDDDPSEKAKVESGDNASDETKEEKDFESPLPSSQKLPYVISVDLNHPSLVAPIIQSVVKALIEVNTIGIGGQNGEKESCTTSVEQLKSVTFGDAPTKEAEDAANTAKSQRLQPKISLTIVCRLPSKNPSTYKEKQAQALVTYHLHRFANFVSCTLIFINSTRTYDDPDVEKPTITGMDVADLRNIMYSLSLGKLPGDEAGAVNGKTRMGEDNGGASSSPDAGDGTITIIKSLYLPADHDTDMIEGTLRRNATCEGSWDVERDSLLAVLPPVLAGGGSSGQHAIKGAPTSSELDDEEYDDQQWMRKLAASIKTAASSSNAADSSRGAGEGKKSSSQPSVIASKRTDKADPDAKSFFENLLKK